MKIITFTAFLILICLILSIASAQQQQEKEEQDNFSTKLSKWASLVEERVRTAAAATTQILKETLKSVNDRANAFNPNSKQFNPTTKQGAGGRAARRSATKAKNNHEKIQNSSSNKSSSTSNSFTSHVRYVGVQSIVKGLLECVRDSKIDETCLETVAQDAGIGAAIVFAIKRVPAARIPILLYGLKDCFTTEVVKGKQDTVQCIKTATKTASSVAITAATLPIPVVGPVIDGAASFAADTAIDHLTDYIIKQFELNVEDDGDEEELVTADTADKDATVQQ